MKVDLEQSLNSELWHACAGGMIQMPLVNSRVFYFPQGHAEHALTSVDFGDSFRIPPRILCRVDSVKYLADPKTDEVYAKILLIPSGKNELILNDDGVSINRGSAFRDNSRRTSFAKTLTQSDANNGGGFSVPRQCAETIFPKLDLTSDPPVQTVLAKDVQGKTWKFRHIYRGTPKRHLLTTGWTNFVNDKKLVAGDSIVFWRADNGDLSVGIRRARQCNFIGGLPEITSGWNSRTRGFGGMSPKEEGKVRPESVVEAAYLAVNGQPFEVEYYPRVNTPEFFVNVSDYAAAMKINWCSGMRFKMQFENEDSSKVSWIMGTITSVHFCDPLKWPNSPWRMLQVMWDEPDLLQNVKCVNPWLVEMASTMPISALSSLSQSRKKPRGSVLTELPLDSQLLPPSFVGKPFGPNNPLCPQNTISGGIQGARHAQNGAPFPDLRIALSNVDGDENISCLLSIGNGSQKPEKTNGLKKTGNQFILFGKPIFIDPEMNIDGSNSVSEHENSPSTVLSLYPEFDLNNGHCRVFLDSEDVDRSIDLSGLRSYEELHKKLEEMFEPNLLDLQDNLLYCDSTGVSNCAGYVPFRDFAKNAKSLSVTSKSGSSHNGSER